MASNSSSTGGSGSQQQKPSSFDQLIADLYQVVAEILLIRRPRVETAAVLTEPPPDLLADLSFAPCPFCPGGGSAVKKGRGLVR